MKPTTKNIYNFLASTFDRRRKYGHDITVHMHLDGPRLLYDDKGDLVRDRVNMEADPETVTLTIPVKIMTDSLAKTLASQINGSIIHGAQRAARVANTMIKLFEQEFTA